MERDDVKMFGISAIWMFFLAVLSGCVVGQRMAPGSGWAFFLGGVSGVCLTLLISEPFRTVAWWFLGKLREAGAAIIDFF